MGGSRFSVAEVGRGGRERIVNVKTRTISSVMQTAASLILVTRLYSDLAWRIGYEDVKDNVGDIHRG